MHFVESSIKHFDLSPQILMLNVQVALSRFSFEKLLSNNPLCFPEILHYFRSTICQPHILIRNSIVLPLTSLEIQVSHKPCTNPKTLIISSKRIFQLRDACTSPQMDRWSLHILLAPLGLTKTFWLHHIQLFFNKSIKEYHFDIHSPDFIKCGNC